MVLQIDHTHDITTAKGFYHDPKDTGEKSRVVPTARSPVNLPLAVRAISARSNSVDAGGQHVLVSWLIVASCLTYLKGPDPGNASPISTLLTIANLTGAPLIKLN